MHIIWCCDLWNQIAVDYAMKLTGSELVDKCLFSSRVEVTMTARLMETLAEDHCRLILTAFKCQKYFDDLLDIVNFSKHKTKRASRIEISIDECF